MTETERNRTDGEEASERVEERFLIIGAGIAALAAAREIRRIHPAASIVLVGEELALPYDRRALSKTVPLPQLGERFALYPPEWYSRQGIFYLGGRVVSRLLPRAKQAELSNGELLSYDKCILATGAQSILPAIDGIGLPGVFTLRTLADLEALALAIRPEARAVILGGGFLGLEAAWQLYLGGCRVTVLENASQLLAGHLSREVSEQMIRHAAEREVDIRVGVTVSRLEGDDGVRRIILPGEYLKADLVLLCCGSSPRTELAREAGLEVDRGIVVNSRMMTAKYGIFACGDCTQIGQTVCATWREAENMGLFAGRNAAGEDAMYHPLPLTLSADFFGIRLITGENGTGEVQKETDHSML